MSIKTTLTFDNLILLFFLLPPVLKVIDNVDIAKQLSLIALIYTCLLAIILKNRVKIDTGTKIFFIFVIYVISNIFVKQVFLFDNLISNDFGEIIRVVGIFGFYLLGISIKHGLDKNDIKRNIKCLVLALLVLVIGFVGKISILKTIGSFYNSEGHRFSGLMPGINYVWFPSLFIVLLFELYKTKCRKKLLFPNIIVYSVILSTLILSTSFTSIIAFLIGLVFYKYGDVIVNKCKKKIVLLPVFFATIIVGGILFFNTFDGLELGHVEKLNKITYFFETGSTDEFSSLQKRFEVWRNVWKKIIEFPMTGHGSNKNELRYTDNSFLMSLYRYGFLGLFIEALFYLYLIRVFLLKTKKYNESVFLLPLALLIAYLVAGMASNVFYELRLPYLLFFTTGYFRGLSPYRPEVER